MKSLNKLPVEKEAQLESTEDVRPDTIVAVRIPFVTAKGEILHLILDPDTKASVPVLTPRALRR